MLSKITQIPNSMQHITELETRWNIHFVPHPTVRQWDQLHNITLVAVATEDNNNTIIVCTEFDVFEFFGLSSQETILTTIGKEFMQ